jgi:glucose/arabinose dehydrogenase
LDSAYLFRLSQDDDGDVPAVRAALADDAGHQSVPVDEQFRPAGRIFASSRAVVFCLCLAGLLGSTPGRTQTFSDPQFVAETVATLPNFTPVGLAWAPDGHLFIWQKNGVVRIFENGGLLPTPYLDFSAKVNTYNDNGMLGLAFDPDYQNNGYVYLTYVLEPGGNPNAPGSKTGRLVRVTTDLSNHEVMLPGSELVILDGFQVDYGTHAIGTIRFAPDGTLFFAHGDGANPGTVDANALGAQDLDNPRGKIFRINPDGTAPTDNPFYDGTESVRSRVWAYGVRNPYRFSMHPTTGEPYFADVGWNEWEEVDRGVAGGNYGWPCYEGSNPQPLYGPFPQCDPLPPAIPPIIEYAHGGNGSCIIGGDFYTGVEYPEEYQGNYFYGDFSGEWFGRAVLDAGGDVVTTETFATGVPGPTSLEQGPDGLLYFVAFETGEIKRILYNGPLAVASASPTSGYSPLEVTFSSAGSTAPDQGILSYFWDFGDGATSIIADPTHTYTAGGVSVFLPELTVTDSTRQTSTATVQVTVGSLPPVPTISAPEDGTGYHPGQTVTYQGSGTDPDDGPLAPAALSWTVLLHHNNTHSHVLSGGTGSEGTFTVEDHGPIGTFSYEVVLTATDSSGLAGTTSIFLPVLAPPASVVITAPADGSAVPVGNVEVQYTLAGDPAVYDHLQLTLDGTTYGDFGLSGSYTLSGVGAGAHTLVAELMDASNQSLPVPAVDQIGFTAFVPAALIAAWSFDESSGAVAGDATGLGHDGAVSGALWTTAGRFGNALVFDGSDDVVLVADSDDLDLGTGAMTLSAWINPTTSIPKWAAILQKEADAYLLHGSSSIPHGGGPGGGGTLGGSCCTSVFGPSVLPVDTWSNVAVTYDGTTLVFYVNGVAVASTPGSGAIQATTTPLRIGNNTYNNEAFEGRIDEVRIYDTALVAAQIQSDMNSPVAAPSDGVTYPAGFEQEIAFSGLDAPTTIRFAPDDRVFVGEKSGRIKIFDDLTDTTPDLLADLGLAVHNFWDRGVLGMALDPDFPASPYVYLLYAYNFDANDPGAGMPRWPDSCPDPPGATDDGCVINGRLSRLEVAPDNSLVGSEQVLLENRWCQQYPSHSTGDLAFDPIDRVLYVSAGDGASFNWVDYGQGGGSGGVALNPCGDPPAGVGGVMTPPSAEGGALRSQDIRTSGDPVSFDGAILAVDPDTGEAWPANPLVGGADSEDDRIIAYGLRNPFRITVREGTHEIWVGDVGWGTWEEINRVDDAQDGTVENFGWPCYEGVPKHGGFDDANLTICEDLYDDTVNPATLPHYAYNHAEHVDPNPVPFRCAKTGSSAIAGLAFYSGSAYPAAYEDALFFADYSRDCIFVMFAGENGLPDPATRTAFGDAVSNPVSLEVGPDELLYYPDINGNRIMRIIYCADPGLDSDNDGTPDCEESCPNDPNKTLPGLCGCGVADTDSDSDGTPDCNDLCPDDPDKTDPEICGCGVAEGSDGDGDTFACAVDCDDADPATFPGAPELCDGDRNNCDTGGGTVVLEPSRDNSLYGESGSLSNGMGNRLFGGNTAVGAARRALLAFDIAGNVPAGANITDVKLVLNVSKVIDSEPREFSLLRLLADWGEGASNAPGQEGGGDTAEPGDATWTERFFGAAAPWTSPGGDFAPVASATATVPPAYGATTWLSTPGLVADVQSWLDNPGNNFGWILIGDETVITTARRFDSREIPTPAVRPKLTVEYITGGPVPGSEVDDDQDGYVECSGWNDTQGNDPDVDGGDDCDDTNDAVFPGAPEICDGIDNQCPGDAGFGQIDEGGALDCHDSNACTDDACDPGNGCVYANNTAPCDDGDACTTADTCEAGVCEGGSIELPLEVNDTLLVDKAGSDAVISWEDEGIPGPFNLYRGFIEAGEPFTYNHVCFSGPITGTSAIDPDTPFDFRTLYYLVTREDECGESIIHGASDDTLAPNDNPCSSSNADLSLPET